MISHLKSFYHQHRFTFFLESFYFLLNASHNRKRYVQRERERRVNKGQCGRGKNKKTEKF